MRQMAIAIALLGFNDLGRSVTHGSFFLPIAYVLKRKNEENLSIRSLIFLQNAPSNSVLFISSVIIITITTEIQTRSLAKCSVWSIWGQTQQFEIRAMRQRTRAGNSTICYHNILKVV